MDEATLGMYASRVWGGTKWCYPNLERLLKEKATLETQLAAANEAVRVLGEYVNHNESPPQDEYPEATHAAILEEIMKNPLARASVEKAGKA